MRPDRGLVVGGLGGGPGKRGTERWKAERAESERQAEKPRCPGVTGRGIYCGGGVPGREALGTEPLSGAKRSAGADRGVRGNRAGERMGGAEKDRKRNGN